MTHIYGLTPSQQALADQAAGIAREVLGRHAHDVDTRAEFPAESVAALARSGFLGLCVPADLDGGGHGPSTFAAVTEELAQGCASTAMIYVMHVAATQAIAQSSTLAERDRLMRRIAAGEHLTTLALSEKGSRSQFWAPVSRMAERNGGFVVTAQKSWVTSASHAHSYVASAQQPAASTPLDSTLYLVRNGESGAGSGGRGKGNPAVRVEGVFEGLGLRGNDSAPVALTEAIIPRDDLVTPPGGGAAAMLQVVLPWFSVGTAAMANGLCRAAVAATAAHLQAGTFDHSGTQLRDLPTLRARLADMSVRTDQARALLGHTLDHLAHPSAATPLYVLQARLASIEAAVDVTDLAMKACGGAAFSRHLGVERLFRDARAGWVMAPTVDHLREFIGRALTGMPLF
jgi:alkylation response protein AidB-like acyl-CoA dehydrogenase